MATTANWLPSGGTAASASPSNNILGYWGQTAPTTTQPGSPGTLSGQSYTGAFANSVSDIPAIGGSLEGILGALYGNKPATADPTATAGQAAAGNTANLPGIAGETLGADSISASGAALPFQMNLPNYENLLGTASGNAMSDLNGQLPSDVTNLIAQQAAERGVSTGQGVDSPNSTASYLKALGLTSLDLQNTGMTDLSQLIAETPTGAAFNPGSGFVTPAQQQSAQQAADTTAAAADPQAAGLMNTLMSFF